MKERERYPVMLGLKLPRDLAAEIRRRARADDRTVSGYLRRLLGATVGSLETQGDAPSAREAAE